MLHPRTNRRRFRVPEDWTSVEPHGGSRTISDLAALEVLGEDVRPRLAEMLASPTGYGAMTIRTTTSGTGGQGTENQKGYPDRAGIGVEPRRVEVNRRFPARWFRERRILGAQDRAKILVLSTREDTFRDAFNCGQVLSAALLECTVAGVATCPLTHITETQDSRDILGISRLRRRCPRF